jgi:hypothetical protein
MRVEEESVPAQGRLRVARQEAVQEAQEFLSVEARGVPLEERVRVAQAEVLQGERDVVQMEAQGQEVQGQIGRDPEGHGRARIFG